MSGLATLHPDRDRLAAFGDGALDDLECARIEEHLVGCVPCLAALESFPDDPLTCLIRGAVGSRGGPDATLQLGDLAPPPLRGGAAVLRLRLQPGYEVLREIGRGGMGAVYLARQVGLNRVVALKKIRPDAHLDPEQQARFRREAEAVAKLDHPNIVQVYEVGEQEGQSYLALEYLDGGTLAEKLAGPLPPREAAGLALTLARAIDHAHRRGIVHRDLKPANILLAGPPPGVDAAGLAGAVVKVADFGLAKDLTRELGQTRTGAIVGTPDYMAPEQAAGLAREVGAGADIWALGAILYECLTGRPPFRGATTLDTLQLVRQQEPVPPSRLQPKVPRDLETICLKCLEKAPAQRYLTAGLFAEDLRRYLAGEPILARRVGPAVQLAKWARRKPAAAALAVACGAFATLAAAGAGWHYLSLSAALKRAEQSEALTRAQYREATATIRLMFEKAADRQMRPIPQLSELQEAQSAAALRFFEQAAREGGGLAAEARRDLALVSNQAANYQRNLGRNAEAERNARRALELLESVIRENPGDNEARGWLVYSHVCLGMICSAERRWDEAESLLSRGVELAEALCRDEPRNPAFKARLGEAYHNLGNLMVLNRRPAVEWYERAAAFNREALREDPAAITAGCSWRTVARTSGRRTTWPANPRGPPPPCGRRSPCSTRSPGKTPPTRRSATPWGVSSSSSGRRA
ncbi:MAG: protein kinase [Gemmataceae bacterium]